MSDPRPMGLSHDRPLVLGSGSPRRRELLAAASVPFVVHKAEVDESVRPGEDAATYLVRITADKLAAVGESLPDELRAKAAAILVADTSVVLDGDVLGKPADRDDAERLVARLAGRAHEVRTRFAVGSVGGAELFAETCVTEVVFRPLTRDEVRAYAETGEGLDKAGAYAIQGRGAALSSRLVGSYTNVVGLPLAEVVAALAALGLRA